MQTGDPILCGINGEEFTFDPSKFGLSEQDVKEGIYPMFVNEAAYYEKDIAFYLTKLIPRTVYVLAGGDSSLKANL